MKEVTEFIENWVDSETKTKEAFLEFKKLLESNNDIEFSFNARPGVSYSLRAKKSSQTRPLFVLLDVIDDDPADRWLSVCFYGDTINDLEEKGDFVPGGLLGEDGHCFDLDDGTKENINYLKDRIMEAYKNAK